MSTSQNWLQSNVQVFWGEIAPCNHLLQIYEDDNVFYNSLEGFAGTGFIAGESVVIIATHKHLTTLNERLTNQGFDLNRLVAEGRYVPLNAEETLSKFMVKDWPDDVLFNKVISGVISTAKKKGTKVRAFGEMVAILWAQGNSGATVHLEHLWNLYCAEEELSLFCAYPKSGFTDELGKSFQHICSSHSKMISGEPNPATQIHYKETVAVKS